MKKKILLGVIFATISSCFLIKAENVQPNNTMIVEKDRLSEENEINDIEKEITANVKCAINFDFKDETDQFNSQAVALVLRYKFDKIFEILKKDPEIKKYLEEILLEVALEETLKDETKKEDKIKMDLYNCLFIRNYNSAKAFKNLLFTHMSNDILNKINEICEKSDEIKNILNNSDIDDKEFEEIKKDATSFLTEKYNFFENAIKDESFLKNLLENKDYKSKKLLLNKAKHFENFDKFKNYTEKEIATSKEKIKSINNEKLKEQLEKALKEHEKIIKDGQNLQIHFNKVRNYFKNYLEMAKKKNTKEKDEQRLNFIKEYYERNKERYEKALEELKNINKNDFDKALNSIDLMKNSKELIKIYSNENVHCNEVDLYDVFEIFPLD